MQTFCGKRVFFSLLYARPQALRARSAISPRWGETIQKSRSDLEWQDKACYTRSLNSLNASIQRVLQHVFCVTSCNTPSNPICFEVAESFLAGAEVNTNVWSEVENIVCRQRFHKGKSGHKYF